MADLDCPKLKCAYATVHKTGGETGIRTLGTLARTTVFETVPFDRSGTSPIPNCYYGVLTFFRKYYCCEMITLPVKIRYII